MVKNITIKNSWSDVSINEYIELQNMSNDEELFTILTNIEDIKGIDIVQLTDIASNFKFVMSPPKEIANEITDFNINNTKFHSTINFKELTTLQYIDLQQYLTDPVNNFAEIMSILIVPFRNKYGEDTYDRELLVDFFGDNMNIELCYNLYLRLTKLLITLTKTFSGVINSNSNDEDEDDEEEIKEITQISSFNQRWGFIYLAEQVKNVIGTDLNTVYNMPVIEYFNYCSYIKEKKIYDEQRIKEYKNQ